MPSGRQTESFPQSILRMNEAEMKAEAFLDLNSTPEGEEISLDSKHYYFSLP